MVEDLMYLLRGGRVSAATAVVGTALNIKPILKIEDDGKLVNFTKKRGAKSALKQMVDFYAESTDGGDGERIYICHADAGDKAEFLEKEIRKINPRCDITSMTLSPIIGAHVQRQVVEDFDISDLKHITSKGFKIVNYTKSDDGDREIPLTATALDLIHRIKKINRDSGEFFM